MGYVKLAYVKLNIYFFALVCLLIAFLSVKGYAGDKYVVQLAATKTPMHMRNFSLAYNISDSITEFKSDFWYHYTVGNFDSFKAASECADSIIRYTKLKKAFVRETLDLRKTQKICGENEGGFSIRVTEKINHDLLSYGQHNEIVNNFDTNNTVSPYGVTENKKNENLLTRIFLRKGGAENLRKVLLDFGKNNIPRNLQGSYAKIVEISFIYPAIYIFIVFIHFFILNIIIVLMILNYMIKKKNHQKRYQKVYGRMYEDIFMSYMFGIYTWDNVLLKIKKIKRKTNRRILISILLNFHENLKGEINNLIPEIYVNLGLHHDSIRLAKSIFNYRKVRGIRELTFLYPKGALGIIPDLINHKNDHVRSEAQAAFIRLNPDNPFKFFDIQVKPFTRWTQLSAFHLIRLYQLPVPNFVKYLDSEHFNIRNFSLRMITYFQQLENVSEIFKMLDSQAEMTSSLTFRAINDLRLYEGKELIKNRFGNETERNKLEIVKALRNIGLTEDLDFLENIISKESVSLKIEACRTMYFMNKESREKLLMMNEKNNSGLELYIAHVTDPRN